MSRPVLDNLPDDPDALKAIVLRMRDHRDQAAREHDEVSRRHDELLRHYDEVSRRHDEARRTIQSLEAKERQLEARAQSLELQSQLLKARTQQLEVEKLRLEMALLRFKKWYYGPRADDLQHPADAAQLLLAFATGLESRPLEPQDLPPQTDPTATDPTATDPTATDPRSVRRVRKGRRDLAALDNLPVTRHVHDLSEDQKPCPCCGEARQKIGEESSWQIEYVPGHFERLEHVQIKYACRRCEQNADSPQIALAGKPQQPIDKGMAGPGLLAYVVTSKFADYLPLYRLENIFARNGFEIDRVTQCLWCRDVARIVRPLYDRMVQRVLGGHVIHTDDTVMPMLAPGKTQAARLWVYVGDNANPYNVFDFTLSRSRDGPARFLKGYGLDKLAAGGLDKLAAGDQVIVADAYGGYDGICLAGGITQAGCWAHARRKFVDTRDLAPKIADEALLLIGKLFTIEQQAASMNSGQAKEKGLSTAERLLLRQSQSQPIVAELRDKLPAWKESLLPKHPVAQAIGYVLNQWKPLTAFLSDGAIAIHNNIAEQEMKRIALNRNYAQPVIMRSAIAPTVIPHRWCMLPRTRNLGTTPHNPDAFLRPSGRKGRHQCWIRFFVAFRCASASSPIPSDLFSIGMWVFLSPGGIGPVHCINTCSRPSTSGGG